MTTTAHDVRTAVLEPAMDATVLTLDIADLINRPETPEPDSVTELLLEQMRVTLHLARIVGQLAQRNGMVLDLERQIAGWADQMVTALRHEELNGGSGKPVSYRDIAKELIPILDLYLQGDRRAADRITRLVRHIPVGMLMQPKVTYHLGVKRTDALRTILDTTAKR